MHIGQYGLFLVRYLGDGDIRAIGSVTQQIYEFNANNQEKYIDRQDIASIVRLKSASGARLFKKA